MGISQELGKYCSELRFQQLPEEVVDSAKYRLLDFISVAGRGAREDSSKSMFRFVREMATGPGKGVIVGTREKAPYFFAALANGTSSHAIEMDDVVNEASLHPGVVVFPAALATGEMLRATGKSFIEAVVLGYEVMIRVGKAVQPEHSYRRGFHPTGTCGVFGASVTTSKILGLKEDGIVNAMGIAGSQASGSMEYLAQGAWTKRFHPGWSAHSGMIAAHLSRKGFRGPTAIIEGRDGFLHAYSNQAAPDKVLEGLGSGYEILRTSVKAHACCRYMQPPIDAVLKLVRENSLEPDQVEKIKVGILRAGALLIAEPMEAKIRPQSIVDAQFSMPFGAAAAVLYRKAGLNEFQVPKIQSEEAKALMAKVECVTDPDLERTFPRQWCATAQISTKDGRTLFTKIEYPKGDPENALTWEEMIDRFHDLCGRTFKKDQRLKIIDGVRKLEAIRDLQEWSPILLKRG